MSKLLLFVTWAARCASLFIVGGILFLAVGEIVSPHSGPPTQIRDYLGFVLLALTLIGMLLAWKWELAGALLSLAALMAFSAMVHMQRFDVVFVIAVPGILFLLDFALRHGSVPTGMRHA